MRHASLRSLLPLLAMVFVVLFASTANLVVAGPERSPREGAVGVDVSRGCDAAGTQPESVKGKQFIPDGTDKFENPNHFANMGESLERVGVKVWETTKSITADTAEGLAAGAHAVVQVIEESGLHQKKTSNLTLPPPTKRRWSTPRPK